MSSSTKGKPQPAPRSLPAQKTIVFFHPDLGIGGAERLIVDAAVGLQELGNKVTIFTSHCDPQHCFEEARDGMVYASTSVTTLAKIDRTVSAGTLDVRVRGNSIFPSTILNRFHILLAILRQIHLVISIAVWSNELDKLEPDVFIVDQLSACVPLLRWLYPHRQRTLFYCHFPDQLLADRRTSGVLGLLKKLYRLPFDWFEGWSMGGSDQIVVNSTFTKSVASRVWPSLASSFGVIYPCVNAETDEPVEQEPLWNNQFKILLSINRFERKKDISLAIRAYNDLSAADRKGTRLIIAGGYDQRVNENVQYHKELVALAEGFGLVTATVKTVPTALAVPTEIQVLFLLSVPGPFKTTLLQNARLLLYTPTNEHFGIVPVEAMQYGLPVLASNTGGPLETLVENETGWLCDVGKVDEWAAVISKVLHDLTPQQLEKMSRNGRQRVNKQFTRRTMAQKFNSELGKLLEGKRSQFLERKDIILGLGVALAFLAALVATIFKAKFGVRTGEKNNYPGLT
ncbi:alpha-1,3/alpha-1,6-mannosyltransferase [Exophiala aquamarina CBS 119918]|uniref:Alpha-1,3/1,6-mannosyltransferase ALG2 n=1 Tax=Exophiala aquamarina CBS 119918 TaxID=1182545 RepID=A0A072P271_9EURO|nr:alpha-1,3/alpha-1,6-mannosyltransferase [Exophiala aquamarina CBS 119918]KEF53951.1 alpha-1,3/alpha-1,6-mannosyltransferase [Exophiala aquamarina CBS 119918]